MTAFPIQRSISQNPEQRTGCSLGPVHLVERRRSAAVRWLARKPPGEPPGRTLELRHLHPIQLRVGRDAVQQNVTPKPTSTRDTDIGSGTALNVTLSMAKFQKLTFAEVIDTVVMSEPDSATVFAALLRLPDRANVTLALSPSSSDTV